MANEFIHKDPNIQREFEKINNPVLERERVISTIADGTAPLAVTSTTVVDNLNADTVDGEHATGIAKAWVMFDGTTNVGGFCTIGASFNVDSVTDNGTGDYTINFTNAFTDANYAVIATSRNFDATEFSSEHPAVAFGTAPTTTAVRARS